MSAGDGGLRDDAVLPATRVLSAVIVPFLVVAFVVLYVFPHHTPRLFAWTIHPTMTPMMLGSVYLGGAYFFVRAYQASAWHTIKVGFVSVTLFASLMGIATIEDWSKFNHTHVAFWLWTALYFTTPFLVAGVWFLNRRRDAPAVPGDLLLSPAIRAVIGLIGLAAVGVGAYLFLFPFRAIDIWPWHLTSLTAKVVGAIFMLGAAGLGVFLDPRWSTARVMVQVEAIMMALILIAALRAHSEFDTSKALTWLLLGGFAATLIGAVVLSVTMDGRARQHPSLV